MTQYRGGETMDFLQSALDSQELMHYGVLGQKWGERRYQNYDGTLTDEGRVHYARKDLRKETIGMSALLAPVGMAYIAIPSSESKKKYTYMQDYKAWLKKYNSNDQSIPRAAARVDDPYASENGYAVFKRS